MTSEPWEAYRKEKFVFKVTELRANFPNENVPCSKHPSPLTFKLKHLKESDSVLFSVWSFHVKSRVMVSWNANARLLTKIGTIKVSILEIIKCFFKNLGLGVSLNVLVQVFHNIKNSNLQHKLKKKKRFHSQVYLYTNLVLRLFLNY